HSVNAEQAIDRGGGLQHVELAGRIRPLVRLAIGKQDRPRRAQGDQAILVEGQPFRAIVNCLNSALNQWGKTRLMSRSCSPVLPRLGALPPHPAWCTTTTAMRLSNAA